MTKSRFTNNYDAHKAIVSAVNIDNHVMHGDVSTTQLIGSPKVGFLRRKFRGDPRIKTDVRDQFWMLFGTIVHEILEQGNETYREYYLLKKVSGIISRLAETESDKKGAAWVKGFAEKMFGDKVDKGLHLERTMTVEFMGYNISGTQDSYHEGTETLEDWKTCTVNATIYYESDKIEWEQQQNIYAYMLRKEGYKVSTIRILALFRDWSKVKSLTGDKTYPPAPWAKYELPIWTDEKVEEYLTERLNKYKLAELSKPADCTPKERWTTKDVFAVMSTSKKRAVRNFSTEEEAKDYIDEYGMKLVKPYIEPRLSNDFKCNFFCDVSKVCDQFKERQEMNRQGKVDVVQEVITPEKVEEFKKDNRGFDFDEFLNKK